MDGAKSAPRVKVTAVAGASQIGVDHPDRVVGQMLLMDALGTADIDFFDGLLQQLANAGSQGKKVDEGALNFMLSVVQGIKPKDQIEAMLAAQMAAVHNAMMTFARRLNHVENITQQDSAERAFNKLARTFAAQVEALKRYRTGGEQRVIVQHVTVSDGASHRRRMRGVVENESQPHVNGLAVALERTATSALTRSSPQHLQPCKCRECVTSRSEQIPCCHPLGDGLVCESPVSPIPIPLALGRAATRSAAMHSATGLTSDRWRLAWRPAPRPR